MKIVIAGAGEMGSHLARMLSGSGHDITVVDSDPKLLAEVSGLADILTIEGDSTTISVLRKAAELNLPEADLSALEDDEAQSLLRLLSRFPDVIREAADRYEPSMITRAVTDIAQAYNKFYYEHRILGDDLAATAARVALTRATKNVIKRGLWLVGIEAPERM